MSTQPEIAETVLTAEAPSLEARIRTLPILVLFPHSRCNCRCIMCDIWKIRQVHEITTRDLEPHRASLRALQVRWVVLSGGEPLLHSHLSDLSRLLRAERIRVTLLTAGLLLERQASMVADYMDDVIVSVDGPPPIHERIRGVPGAFRRLTRGVEALRERRPQIRVQGRCTVQKDNCVHLRETVHAAREMKLDSISFLAADVTSEAFNRPQGWSPHQQDKITLNADEVERLRIEIEALIRECGAEIEQGFVTENAEKLRRIELHFRAHLGQVLPAAPRCNAPWVSAVIEADGTVRPCFFHRPLGHIEDGPLQEVLNSPEAVQFRRQLDIATNPVCQKCVCALYLSPGTRP